MIRIFVTGSTGFIGSNLKFYLSNNQNYQIYLINRKKLLNTKNTKIINFYYDGDINKLINFFKKNKPDLVIHLATNFVSQHDEKQIDSLISSNVLFGTQILEAMSKTNCKYFINFGTYWQNYKTYEYNPVNLYAATKESFEKILVYYNKVHLINYVTLMLSDTFGIRDKRKKLIDTLIHASINNKNINLTDGKQILDITYIDTIISNIQEAINFLINSKRNISSTYFITGYRLSIKKIVKIIEKITNSKINAKFGKYKYRKRTIMKPIKIKKKMHPPWTKKIKQISFEHAIEKILNFNDKK